MSINPALSDHRTRLIEATIRLLVSNGPSDVKARSVSDEAGLSTMGVYKHFGGVPELLQAVAEEGLKRLTATFEQVPNTSDPTHDLTAMALACRDAARRSPHLYDLMFGLAIHGRHSHFQTAAMQPPSESSQALNAVLSYLTRSCVRLIDAKQIQGIDPALIAAQLWSTCHGMIMLELTNHFTEVADPASEILVPMCRNLIAGLSPSVSLH